MFKICFFFFESLFQVCKISLGERKSVPVVVGLNWLLRSDVRVRGWLGLRNQDVEGAQDVVKIKELRKALKSLLRIKAEGASSSDFFLFSGKLGVLNRYTPT
ncbi:hypothetical protein AtNW77_Chr2g0232041 [Arabidopsis thaliana]